MRWIRLDVSFDESWLFVLSAESQLAWIKLLCHVKRDGVRGTCKAIAPIVAAKKWGVGEEAVTKMLQAAVSDGAIVSDGHTWQIVNWLRFQDSDQTNAERQRRHRDRQKGAPQTQNVTPDNGGVTVSNGVTERYETVTESNGVTDRYAVTPCRVTETLTETELTTTPKPPPSEIWHALPGVDSRAVEVVQTVHEAVDKRGAKCYRNQEVRESDVLRFLEFVDAKAPDWEAVRRDVLRAWQTECLKHDGCKYPNAVQRMEQWAGRCEPDWSKVRLQRASEAAVLSRSNQPAPKSDIPVKGVDWEEGALPGSNGVRIVPCVKGTKPPTPITRDWARTWFQENCDSSDWADLLEGWCAEHNIPDAVPDAGAEVAA